jgi:hypothetical protein
VHLQGTDALAVLLRLVGHSREIDRILLSLEE